MNTDHSDFSQGNILVVDDTPANLQFLTRILADHGYTVRPVKNGKMALWGARGTIPPDLILLDIMMPDMDGYEVCQQLKVDERTRDIPVIFLSALDDVSDKIKAFSIGGVDYITKPFKEEEVLARVQTHLELKHAREKLKQQNRELTEAARLREDVDRITRHDLKTPLNAIIGFPQVMMSDGNLTAKQSEHLKIIKKAGLTMLNMINFSLDMFKMERRTYKFKSEHVNVLPTIRRIINDLESLVMAKKLSVTILIDGKPADNEAYFSVQGEGLLCYSMLANLIKNAFEASPQEERITVELAEEEEMSVIRIHNKGAVPEDIRDRFFDKYVTSRKKSGTGLGTYSAWLIAETQGGSIQLDTSEENGTAVTVRLPSQTPEMRSVAQTGISTPLSTLPAKSDRKEHILDSETMKRLPELIRILETEFLPRQEELNDMLIMDDASQFAEDLGHVGREYGLRFITDFCDNLLDEIEIFDVVGIKKRITEFPRIIEKLA